MLALDLGKVGNQIFRLARHAHEAAALFEMDQVRRTIHPHPETRLQQDGLQHGASRTFAIGAGHSEHDWSAIDRFLPQRGTQNHTHAQPNLRHIMIQPQVNANRVQLLAMGQPVSQRGTIRKGEEDMDRRFKRNKTGCL